MKIGYMGFGAWGCALVNVLAKKGHHITIWARDFEKAKQRHGHLGAFSLPDTCRFTDNLKEALHDADVWVESVTSRGVRAMCEHIRDLQLPLRPLIFTSKGIEQATGFILPDVAESVFEEECVLGMLSGPGYAEEIIQGKPTSVVGASSTPGASQMISAIFTTDTFRVYPNPDMRGVALGGALKNIYAIACGISDGLGYGHGARAGLMTRGLHEMVKLACILGCSMETLYGLSGMGDVFLTCSSLLSRNYRFGDFLAKGLPVQEAIKAVGSAVEGYYTCLSAYELKTRYQIHMPIMEVLYRILFEALPVKQALPLLMHRMIKEEAL